VIVFFGFIIAVFMTMVLIQPLMRLAVRWHFVDLPDARKVHSAAIPRIGGVAMVIGAMVPVAVWLMPQTQIAAILAGVAIILLFGVWDDRSNLDYRVKFLGQILAVLIVVIYGGISIRYVPFWSANALPDYLAIPITVFALLGITNAINLADGLDGLAGGTTLLSLGMIAILAYMVDGTSEVLIAVSVMGSILGFLRYNTYPARVFMGDGGSQFLGFSVGVLVILLTQQVNPMLSPSIALMLLGLPVLDTVMVIGQRVYEKRSAFSPDKNHIHHKLLALAFTHYEAVFLIYLIQSLFVLGAYFLRYQPDGLVVSVYLLLCAAVIVFFRLANLFGWRMHVQKDVPSRLSIERWLGWLRQDDRLLKAVFYFTVSVIAVFLVLGALLVAHVSQDVAWLAGMLLLVMCLAYFKRRGQPFHTLERAVAYITLAMVVYLAQVAPGVLGDFALLRNVLLGALVVSIAIGFRFSRTDTFSGTTLDYLIIFIALVVPNLPDLHLSKLGGANVGVEVAKLIILFYAIELVLTNTVRRWNIMRWVVSAALLVLVARGALT